MTDRINSKTLYLVPWDEMVRRLYPWSAEHSLRLVGPATGISTSVSKLLVASSIEEIASCMGRMEYHVEAMYQTLGGRRTPLADKLAVPASDPSMHQVLGTVLTALSFVAGNLVQGASLVWHQPMRFGPSVETDLRMELLKLEVMLGALRDFIGIRQADILRAYQVELSKQFPDQCYTDVKPDAGQVDDV